MDNQICVNCNNEKTVNSTTNRLVTESCGHVKCMDCLLHEKDGCIACVREKEPEVAITVLSTSDNEEKTKKKKPCTTHITVFNNEDGSRTYTCTVCSKSFHARSQVQYHAYCNGQQKPYQCPDCDKSFATRSHYKYHTQVHRNERTYECDICRERFFQMSKLQRHKLKHTKEKKYTCDQCSKGFNNLTSLRKHGLTHTEEKPYSCPTCGRRFRDGSNFRKHLAKHTENGSWSAGRVSRPGSRRAHQCPRCPQSFHSNKDMRRHSAVHSDLKPFRCKVCDRRFRRKDNLERHIKNTHPNFVPSSAVEIDEIAANEQLAAIQPNGDSLKEQYQKNQLEITNPLPPLSREEMLKHMDINTSALNEFTEVEEEVSSYIREANIARESVIFGPINKKESVVKKDDSPEYEYVHKIRKANSMASKDVSLPPIDEKKIIELELQNHLNNLAVNLPPKNIEVLKKILGRDPAGHGQQNGAEIILNSDLVNLNSDIVHSDLVNLNSDLVHSDLVHLNSDIVHSDLVHLNSDMVDLNLDPSEMHRVASMEDVDECEKSHQNNTSPEMHWRRKMKLNINW